MQKIKNHLLTTFNSDNIPTLIQYTTTNYRPYDPGQYLYRMITEFSNEMKFSDRFIELAYTTLIAWNMNQRKAKLSDFKLFKHSLRQNRKKIQSLENLLIEDLSSINDIAETIEFLFNNLQLVFLGKPKLVTFSKTLHFFLPNLLIPIDRRYTLSFFYSQTSIPNTDIGQFRVYCDIFEQFRQLSTAYNFNSHKNEQWNKNTPKIIDNIIIAYIKTNL